MKSQKTILITCMFLTVLLLTICCDSGLADRSPGDMNAIRPGRTSGDIIVPDQWLQSWDPVTVFFQKAKGPVDPGIAIDPGSVVTMVPAHPGGWRWLNSRTLQFVPVEPWPPFTTFKFMAGKASAELHTVLPAPTDTTPDHGDNDVPQLETITLVFPQTIDPDVLADHITLQMWDAPAAEGQPRQILDKTDFRVKRIGPDKSSDKAAFLLALGKPVPNDTRVKLNLDLTNATADTHSYVLDFMTTRYFSVLSVGGGSAWAPVSASGGDTQYDPLSLNINPPVIKIRMSSVPEPVTPTALWDFVHIAPAVNDLKFTIKDRIIELRGGFLPDQIYSLTLRPTTLLKDDRNRELHLESAQSIPMVFRKPRAEMKWNQGMAIVERYGPKMLPLKGRGNQLANLRIYKIDPLDKTLWPFPAAGIVVDKDRLPEKVLAGTESYHEQTRYLSQWELNQTLKTMGSPLVSQLIELPLKPMGTSQVYGIDVSKYLEQIEGKNSPGTYLAGIQAADSPGLRHWMRFQVTDLAVTTIEEPDQVTALVTSLESGRPFANVRVIVEGYQAGKWNRIMDGKTDAMGVCVLKNKDTRGYIDVKRVRLERGRDIVVFDTQHPPQIFRYGHWSSEGDWLYSVVNHPNSKFRSNTLAHVFTERPVYKPDEPVHIRGWLRKRATGSMKSQTGMVTIEVTGPGGQSWSETVNLSKNGGFYHEFTSDDCPAGAYDVFVRFKDKFTGSCSFSMEDYRIPTFEVLLHGDDIVSLDRAFNVSMTASYYAGGVMIERPVDWKVTQHPLNWKNKALPGYRFADDDRFSGRPGLRDDSVLDLHRETDNTGADTITIDPLEETSLQVRTYVVEASVTGIDDQVVTSMKRIKALPAFLLGMKTDRVVTPGSPLTAEIAVLDPENNFLAEQDVMVRLIHRSWHTVLKAGNYSTGEVKYDTHIVDTPIEVDTVQSGDKPLIKTFSVKDAGVYVIEVSARDRLGRAQIVQMDVFVQGDSPVTWERPSDRKFTAKPGAKSYKPGQTAKIILESPFQTAEVVAVVESPKRTELIHTSVRNGSGVIHIPVKDTWCPQIPVSILLMRGRLQGTRLDTVSGMDLGKPQTLGTSVSLKVSDEGYKVNIDLEHPKRARPGETIDLALKLTDENRHPLAGEAAVWLVDRAVLALGKETNLNPLDDLLKPWPSHVSIRDTREFTTGQLPWVEKPGGGYGAMSPDFSLFDKDSLRKDFKPVPYYNPFVDIGSDGIANLSIDLPDNLTQFAVRVKAASGNRRFGFAAGRLAVSLPLVMQPTLPRYIRPGDQFQAVGVSRLVEGDTDGGNVMIDVDGLIVSGDSSMAVTWEQNVPVRNDFKLSVPDAEYDSFGQLNDPDVTIRMAAERSRDRSGDSVEIVLPKIDGARMWTDSELHDLKSGDTVMVQAIENQKVRPGTAHRQITVSTSPMIGLALQAESFLKRYPYDCTEQRVSRASGILAMQTLNQMLQKQSADDTRDRIQETIDFIPGVVTPEGLVSFWPGGKGYVHLTARVVRFLADARSAGYDVDPVVIERLSSTLKSALRSDNPFLLKDFVYTERCLALESLQKLNMNDVAYTEELARYADAMGIEDRARIARQLMDLVGVDPMRIDALVNGLIDDVIFETIDGELVATRLRKTWNHPQVMQSDITALAEVTRTLIRHNANDSRIRAMFRGISNMISSRVNTTYLADSIILLVKETLSQGAVSDRAVVTIDGEQTDLGPDNPLLIISDNGEKPLDITLVSGTSATLNVETRGYPVMSPEQLPEQARGFAVNRTWWNVDEEGRVLNKVPCDQAGQTLILKVGDIIEEQVQVVNATDRNYVVVNIPLAAGMEPLNPRLATAPPEAEPQGNLTRSPEYMELRDHFAVYYYNDLPKGTYSFYFRTRASFEGTFSQPGAWATMMYNLEETGASSGAIVKINPAD